MPPCKCDSNIPNTPGVTGTNTAGGIGVLGQSNTNDAVHGNTSSPTAAGVSGFNLSANAPAGPGVFGHSDFGSGVSGDSKHSIGVLGTSEMNDAVHGNSNSTVAAGVSGFNLSANAPAGPGVFGSSSFGDGVVGQTQNPDPTIAGVHGRSLKGDGTVNQGGLAGLFEGSVRVTGDIFLPGADCAEQFDIGEIEEIEPGTVVVIDQQGALRKSEEPYDKRVAGVVSGAGGYRPGIVLDKQAGTEKRQPVALVGKVYCKVDAQYSPIEVGDLLTTSPTAGHAMKADNPLRAFGAVIGKALRALPGGRDLIPILVALQ